MSLGKIPTIADAELIAQVRKLQNIQRTHAPSTSAWMQASELLKPLFKECGRRKLNPALLN